MAKLSSVSQEVLNFFREEDKKGHGLISRERVVTVLQWLDPNKWTDERVDQLMQAYGKCSDGHLDYSDFAAWLSGGHIDLVRLGSAKKLQAVYELTGQIGEGGFGTVRLGTHKGSGAKRAVKTIRKTNDTGQQRRVLDSEIAVMKQMDHPNIVRIFEVFEDTNFLHLVMELCGGGELLDRIIAEKSFTEKQTANVVKQALAGLCHMHMLLVAHRDVKLENFLLQDKDEPLASVVIKLADFGLSRCFKEGEKMKTLVGTPNYIAPEILNDGEYTQACDLWSSGVITFVLLCGYPPFLGRNHSDIMDAVKKGAYVFHEDAWEQISGDAKDFIQRLMELDVNKRATISEALEHTWIRDLAPRASTEASLGREQLESIRTFSQQNRLKKAALHAVAHRLGEDDLKGLKDAFASADKNQDGLISYEDLREALGKLGKEETTDSIMNLATFIDIDGDRRIDYTEFIAAAIERRHYEEERTCLEAFQIFDIDGSNFITRKELLQVLCDKKVESLWGSIAIARVMDECDKNSDGVIDFPEFLAMMRS